jgi:hypothetical protein
MHKVFLFVIVMITGSSHVYAMEPEGTELHSIFMKKGPIQLTLEETLPINLQDRNGALALLSSTPLEFVKITESSSAKTPGTPDVGYTFPTTAPWCLLTTQYIKETVESSARRVNVGDWGCGHGFFARHALLSGANPYAIELHKLAAQEANKNIYGARKHLPEGLDIKELYKAFHGSVTRPIANFMNRTNDINVAFNVLHHLTPEETDLFLKKMFENTTQDGLIVICGDTPFFPSDADYYNEGLKKGLKYPGFGIYNKSSIVFSSNVNQKSTVRLSAYRPTKKELHQFEMGHGYLGSYPPNKHLDDTRTIFMDDQTGKAPENILKTKEPYYYRNSYQLMNLFDYGALKNIVESAGFAALNGWYTDHMSDTLYPHDVKVSPSLCKKSKVVIVAKKK